VHARGTHPRPGCDWTQSWFLSHGSASVQCTGTQPSGEAPGPPGSHVVPGSQGVPPSMSQVFGTQRPFEHALVPLQVAGVHSGMQREPPHESMEQANPVWQLNPFPHSMGPGRQPPEGIVM